MTVVRRLALVTLLAVVGALPSAACGSGSGSGSDSGTAGQQSQGPPLVTLGKSIVSGTASISASNGGTVTWPASGDLPGGSLVVLPHAVDTDTSITVTAYDGGSDFGTDAVFYELSPEGLVLKAPAKITIGYRQAWVARMGFSQTDIRAVHISSAPDGFTVAESVESFPPLSWNPSGHVATFSIGHFSILSFDFSDSVQIVQSVAGSVHTMASSLAKTAADKLGLDGVLQTFQSLVFKQRMLGEPADNGDSCAKYDDCQAPAVEGDVGDAPPSPVPGCADTDFKPLGTWQRFADPFWKADSTRPKFILIHGITATYRAMVPLGEQLKAAFGGEADVYYYDYPSGKHIEDNAVWLASFIGQNAQPGFKVNIVTHSMGGLVARWAMEHQGMDKYVQNLFTLGTPHKGSIDSDAVVAGILAVAQLADLAGHTSNYTAAALGTLTLPPFQGIIDLSPSSSFITTLSKGGPYGANRAPAYFPFWTPEDHCVVQPDSQQGTGVVVPAVPIANLSVTTETCTIDITNPGGFARAHGDIYKPCKTTPMQVVVNKITRWICNPPSGDTAPVPSVCCAPSSDTGATTTQKCTFWDSKANESLVNCYDQPLTRGADGSVLSCAETNASALTVTGERIAVQCTLPEEHPPVGQCVPVCPSLALAKCTGPDWCNTAVPASQYLYSNPDLSLDTFEEACVTSDFSYTPL